MSLFLPLPYLQHGICDKSPPGQTEAETTLGFPALLKLLLKQPGKCASF